MASIKIHPNVHLNILRSTFSASSITFSMTLALRYTLRNVFSFSVLITAVKSKMNKLLKPPFTSSECFKDSFTIKAAYGTNFHLRHSKSLPIFKTEMRKYLFARSYSTTCMFISKHKFV